MSWIREVRTVPIPITARDSLDDWLKNQQRPIVLGEDVAPTMLPTWNRSCRDEGGGMGLARGWHVILAGNTGSGKSVAALNAAAAAMRSGMNVGFVSLEMSITQLETRFYSILTGDPIRTLERGKSFDAKRAKATTDRVHQISKDAGGWFIANQDLGDPMREIGEVVGEMDRWHEEYQCRMFVVDYLQLVGSGDSREVAESVMQVSRAMMGYAKSRAVITIGLSQFNRGTSSDYDHSPSPQGLYGSSGLENDAHQVVMLDHSRYRATDNEVLTWAIVGKNRHGMTPSIPVRLDKTNLRLTEGDPHEEHLWPTHKNPNGT